MTAYIALLRGVNVGGNALNMAWLRAACGELGLGDIRTYLQSGNIVFSSRLRAPKLAEAIKTRVDTQTRRPVTVVIRSAAEMATIVAGNPFPGRKGVDVAKLHISFLDTAPTKPALEGLDALAGHRDQYRLVGREVYLYCPLNYGETKLSNTAVEKVLGVDATTRNWKTVTTLLKMAAS